MKRIASYGTAVLVAFLSVTSFAWPAAAAGPRVHVEVDRAVLTSGQTFAVTATAGVRCQWLVQFDGERRVQTGRRFKAVFTAARVTTKKRFPVRATCFYTPPGHKTVRGISLGGTRERITVYVPERKADTVAVTVLPSGAVEPPHNPKPPHGGPGGLPNTGGPNWWLLVAGLGSLAAGVVIVRRTTARVASD